VRRFSGVKYNSNINKMNIAMKMSILLFFIFYTSNLVIPRLNNDSPLRGISVDSNIEKLKYLILLFYSIGVENELCRPLT
jgi:hypothetical protein